ncbi:hypothetical protein E2C01_050416 [Portunus trituberculatus]|uniref:Uncharacterized protein n=1 Tax=Portunus trituberculatus TaxID=210409 RepID=A0A5B7GGC2_PORTR|nr:hypothetical protein [Portunus trituberculatus]
MNMKTCHGTEESCKIRERLISNNSKSKVTV